MEHANCEDLLSLRDSHNVNVIRFLTQLGYQGSAAFRMLLLEEMGNLSVKIPNQKIYITCVKSCCLSGGFVPRLENFDEQWNRTMIEDNYKHVPQRLIADYSFGSGKRAKYLYVVLRADDDAVWVAKQLRLLGLTLARKKTEGKKNLHW